MGAVAAETEGRRPRVVDGLALLILGAIVYWPAIAHGGFYADDWENSASAIYYYESSSVGPFRPAFQPLLSVVEPLPHLLFGPRPAWHLALALVIGVAASLLFASILVRLGLSRLDAFTIAALALILPMADSLRLYSTAAINAVALIPCFAGVAGGIDRLRGGEGWLARRYRWLLGASVLTYSAVVPVCLLTGPVYRLAGVDWARAKVAWRGDALRMLAPSAFVLLLTTHQHLGPGAALAHAARITRDGVTAFGRALVPIDGIPHSAVAAVVAVLCVVLALWLQTHTLTERSVRPSRKVVQRWLTVAGLGVIATAVCWLPYASAAGFYHPLAAGILNRVNTVAAFPIALVVYALAGVIVSPLRRFPPALLVLPIAIGWFVWIRRDTHEYELAARVQAGVLREIHALPTGGRAVSVFVGGYPPTSAPGVPVFLGSWDLDGAVKLTLGNGRSVGQPLRTAATLVCGRVSAVPDDPNVNRLAPQPYADLFLLNAATHRWVRVRDQRECLAGAGRIGFRARRGIPIPRDDQGRPTRHVYL